MTSNASDMLRLLGSGVRPAGVGVAPQTKPIEGSSFAELLANVKTGNVSSDQPLSMKHGLDLPLTPSQQSRLSSATDAAQVNGASRVIAVMDNQAYTIDVDSRTIESAMPWAPGALLTDVDAVMMVPEDGLSLDSMFSGIGQTAQAAGNAFAGLARSGSQSLNELLARIADPAADQPTT